MNLGDLAVDVIVPALNEEEAIGKVIGDLPPWIRNIWVVDNGSTDGTARVARDAGARVLIEKERGYGAACLLGVEAALREAADVLVFLDGDYSDYPEQVAQIIAPIIQGKAQLVIGSRELGQRTTGSLMPQQRFGNWLATRLMHWMYGVKYTDLGPFRAITRDAYGLLGMKDRNYGWTVEMQVRAAQCGIQSLEVPVDYRARIGTSKVSGTVLGSVRAGHKIISTLFKLHFRSA
jgi:glycosyltransferase involved in cell wall biosynthesis